MLFPTDASAGPTALELDPFTMLVRLVLLLESAPAVSMASVTELCFLLAIMRALMAADDACLALRWAACALLL